MCVLIKSELVLLFNFEENQGYILLFLVNLVKRFGLQFS